jgi:hypothetical protein
MISPYGLERAIGYIARKINKLFFPHGKYICGLSLTPKNSRCFLKNEIVKMRL